MKFHLQTKYIILIFLFQINRGWTQFQSKLPIISINTNGQTILDEPKVGAMMDIIDYPNKQYNNSNDIPNLYSGKIGIELRGSSSQIFPKKPYSIEIWNQNNEDLDTTLFGWPKESDFVLFTSYNEKSLMHNVLAMQIGRELGMYASRTKYVDVILNGEYQGIYVLMEKVKRGKGRVDISKLTINDISGDELTGGYIIKVDKNTGGFADGWSSKYDAIGSYIPHSFLYDTPKDINAIQKEYIQNYVSDFEDGLAGSNFKDTLLGYRKYIDVKSFIRMLILNEVSGNIDGYRISTYLYKDKESKGGKLTMGPPWDYDLSFGNADYCGAPSPEIWYYKFSEVCPNDYFVVPFWWNRFFKDPKFKSELYQEYTRQRKEGVLQIDHLFSIIDSLKNLLEEPQVANFKKWPILGQKLWPNPDPVPTTWVGEINELKDWLQRRMTWLDKQISLLPDTTEEEVEIFNISINGNILAENSTIKLSLVKDQSFDLTLYNSSGNLLAKNSISLSKGIHSLTFNENLFHQSTLPKGLYFLKYEDNLNKEVYKLIKLE